VLCAVFFAEECEEIIRVAEPRLKPSVVVDKKSHAVNSTVLSQSGLRTSSGMFLDRAENSVITGLCVLVGRKWWVGGYVVAYTCSMKHKAALPACWWLRLHRTHRRM
jgi:hypothetical protein